MIGFLLILSIPILFVGIFVLDIRHDLIQDRLKKSLCEKESKEWLEKEKILPKYCVEVTTKTNKIYRTKYFEPFSQIYEILGWRYSKESSLDRAKTHIHSYIKNGAYYHKEIELFIPMCEIESIQAIVAEN